MPRTLWLAALSLFATAAIAAPVPKEKPREGLIGVVKDGEVLLLKPDGTVAHRLKPKTPWPEDATAHPAPTASGFPVAVEAASGAIETGKNLPTFEWSRVWLIAGPDHPDGKALDLGDAKSEGRVLWSRDGRRLFAQCFPPDDEVRANVAKYRGPCGVGKCLAVDPATGKAIVAAVPDGHELIGETADGKLLTNGRWPAMTANAPNGPLKLPAEIPLHLVSADGKTVADVKKLPARYYPLDLAPDGRTLLCQADVPGARFADQFETFDIQTGETALIEPVDLKGKFLRAAHTGGWSPDGKRVVFGYGETDEKSRVRSGWKLMACDADGKNCKELLSTDGATALKASWK